MKIFTEPDNVLFPGNTKMKKNVVYVLNNFIGYGEETEKNWQ